MQTSRELIRNMFSGGDVDRFGIYEGFWSETLDRWVEQGYPADPNAPAGSIEPIDPFVYFEFDLQACGGFFDPAPIPGVEEILEETEDWVVKRDGAGATHKSWKTKSGLPQQIDFAMKTRQIWERDYKPHLLSPDRSRFNSWWWGDQTLEDNRAELERARKRDQWSYYGHNFLWSFLRASLGDINLLRALKLDPGWIKDFNATYTAFHKAHFDLLIEENGLPDGIWIYDDLAYKGALFASPQSLRELFLPYYADLTNYFHAHELPVIFHSDGDMRRAIPIIIEAGFTGLNPMEAKAGCDLLSIARNYKDDLVLIGGFDVRILETNDRDLIEREIIALLRTMKDIGARFVFGSDHTISSDVDFDTYCFALDVFRKHRMY